ncbi:MAG: DUF483 domain-containing protein [Clostridia bacterium]
MINDQVKEMFDNEKYLSKKVIIEQMVLLKLGIKNIGILTFPQHLYNGEKIAEKIALVYDEKVKEYEENFSFRKLSFTKKRMMKKAIKHKKDILSKVYDDIVYNDQSYKKYIEYAEKLKIMGVEYKVRPSLRELVLFADADVQDRVKEILKFRLLNMEEAKESFNEKTPMKVILYPEELKPEYVQAIGKLYGYPQCCIDAYMKDRAKGDNPEARGAIQYFEYSKDKKFEEWAYFISEFIPCRPDCKAAQDVGKKAYQKLIQFDSDMGNLYKSYINENAKVFEEQSKELKDKIIKMQKQNKNKKKKDAN